MLTIEFNNDVLKKIIVRYYEMMGIKATLVRFDTNDCYSECVTTNIIVHTVIDLMGEEVNATTTIDDELLHEIICFFLPDLDIYKVEKNYETKSFRNEGYKEFCGVKVTTKMKNKELKKECGIYGT